MTAGEKLGTRMERRKEETRSKIIDTAIALFRKLGFDGTTMELIAEEADVSKGTLYNYFPLKEAIVSEFVKRDFEKQAPEFLNRIESQADTRSQLITYQKGLLEWVKTYKELAKVYIAYRMRCMLQNLEQEEYRSGSQVFIRKILQEGQLRGEIRRDIPLEILTFHFDFIRVALVKEMLSNPDYYDIGEQTKKYVDLFIEGAKSGISESRLDIS